MQKLLAATALTAVASQECSRFDDIYANGEELCNTIFGTAFVYTTDEAKAYTMWWSHGSNPNDEVAAQLLPNSTEYCHLDYLHKDSAPGPEPPGMTECHPWKDNSCCKTENVLDPITLNTAYGEGYRWDRCGKLSQACERFFVQEACMYECSPHIGQYRKYPEGVYDPNNEEHNKWEVYQMPIKASYCDAWFDACYADMFCGEGNFFDCNAIYEEEGKGPNWGDVVEVEVEKATLSTGAIVAIVVSSVAAVALASTVLLMYCRERAGKPMFAKMDDVEQIDQFTDAELTSVAH